MSLFRCTRQLADLATLVVKATDPNGGFKTPHVGAFIKLILIKRSLTVLTELEFGPIAHLSLNKTTGARNQDVSFVQDRTFFNRFLTTIGAPN